jgi:hypothetical protein
MPIPGSAEDGTMTADLAQFDLAHEMADSEGHKPWPSGIHSRTLFKKPDFLVVLICMEAGATIKEHHAEARARLDIVFPTDAAGGIQKPPSASREVARVTAHTLCAGRHEQIDTRAAAAAPLRKQIRIWTGRDAPADYSGAVSGVVNSTLQISIWLAAATVGSVFFAILAQHSGGRLRCTRFHRGFAIHGSAAIVRFFSGLESRFHATRDLFEAGMNATACTVEPR